MPANPYHTKQRTYRLGEDYERMLAAIAASLGPATTHTHALRYLIFEHAKRHLPDSLVAPAPATPPKPKKSRAAG